ncbi:MAG TPA: alpha/beta hydrolase [Anaerovoracaceae bacterium]|nr:alpha/beta hydrolase [Anaerovoracaceae bacterium]
MSKLGMAVEKADYFLESAKWYTKDGADANKVILYFYGGEFETLNSESYQAAVSNFIDTVGYTALLFRCAPASGISAAAAINESAQVYLRLLEQGYQPKDIVFVGDRTGGGIEICTLAKLRDEGIPLPAACVAFSPNLDMTSSLLLDPAGLFGNPAGLPPIMIHAGYQDEMYDDVIRFGEIAESFSADIRIRIWKGLSHVCPLLASRSEGSMEAIKQADVFIRQNQQKGSGIAAALLYMTMFSIL